MTRWTKVSVYLRDGTRMGLYPSQQAAEAAVIKRAAECNAVVTDWVWRIGRRVDAYTEVEEGGEGPRLTIIRDGGDG